MKPQPIKDIINGVFCDLNRQPKKITPEEVQKIWREVVGDETALHARYNSFENQTVYITVDHSARLFELRMRKGALLKQMRQKMGEHAPQHINFRVGE